MESPDLSPLHSSRTRSPHSNLPTSTVDLRMSILRRSLQVFLCKMLWYPSNHLFCLPFLKLAKNGVSSTSPTTVSLKIFYNKICFHSNLIFSHPSDSKLKLGPSSSINTYTPHFIASPFFESLRVCGPYFFTSAKSSPDGLFDQHQFEFSELLQEYGNKMMELSKIIIKVLLRILGDGYDGRFCESEFSNCHGYLRIVNYSPPKNVEEKEVEGLGMHTGMSCNEKGKFEKVGYTVKEFARLKLETVIVEEM